MSIALQNVRRPTFNYFQFGFVDFLANFGQNFLFERVEVGCRCWRINLVCPNVYQLLPSQRLKPFAATELTLLVKQQEHYVHAHTNNSSNSHPISLSGTAGGPKVLQRNLRRSLELWFLQTEQFARCQTNNVMIYCLGCRTCAQQPVGLTPGCSQWLTPLANHNIPSLSADRL